MTAFSSLYKHPRAAALAAVVVLMTQGAYAQTGISSPQGTSVPAAVQAPILNPLAGSGTVIQNQNIVISGLVGEAWILNSPEDTGRLAQNGEKLTPGQWIKIGDPGAVEITLEGGTKLFLSAGALFKVEKAAKDTRQKTFETILRLDFGKLKAEVAKQGESPFKIQTPTAVASVRGTVLYLSVSQIAANLASTITDLFVDEGAVDFGSIENAFDSVLVREFGSSSVAGDGTVVPERQLTREERNAFVDSFDQAFANIVAGNPQFGVERGALPGGQAPQNVQNTGQGGGLNDFIRDFVSAQGVEGSASRASANRLLIAGLLVNTLLDRFVAGDAYSDLEDRLEGGGLLSEGALGVGLNEWDFDTVSGVADAGIVTDERLPELQTLMSSRKDADAPLETIDDSVDTLKGLFAQANANPNNTGFVPPALQAADEADDAREEIEDADDASSAAFKRLEALRRHERDLLQSELSSLLDAQTERTTQAQIERTFDAQTGKVFTDIHGNRVRVDQYIDQPEPDHVRVTSLTYRAGGDLAGVTAMVWEARFNSEIEGLLRDLPWNDYLNVVEHERLQAFLDAQGGYGCGTECENTGGSYIVHEASGAVEPAFYPTEFKASFKNPAGDRMVFEETYGAPEEFVFGESEGDSFWAQREDSNRAQFYLAGLEEPVAERADGSRDLYNDHGSQSEVVNLENFDPADPIDHPAYFVDEVLLTEAGYEAFNSEGQYFLVGQTIPFDNNGKILNVPGFSLRGIRDLIRPQTVVSEGRYNLEVILQFGYAAYSEEDDREYFEPLFTIDAIVTPEIFGPYGVANTSLRFPDELVPDEGGSYE